MSWDVIDPADGPRMTPGQAFYAEPQAADYAVALNRLLGIFRTGWIKPAGASGALGSHPAVVGREGALVGGDQKTGGAARPVRSSVGERKK